MKKYLVGISSSIAKHDAVRSCTVDMPDDYNLINDSPSTVYSFPKLRAVVADRMKAMCTTGWEYEWFAADKITVIAVSCLGEVNPAPKEVTLESRVQDILRRLGENKVNVQDVIKYLPDKANCLSYEELVGAVYETIN